MCGRDPAAGKSGKPSLRAASRCSLPDWDPEDWDESADPEAAAYAEEQAQQLPPTLGFDFERDGCPWGWATSPYAVSVTEYMGRRSVDSDVRAPSLRLMRRMLRDEEEPIDLLDAVTIAEAYEDGAFAQFHALAKSP